MSDLDDDAARVLAEAIATDDGMPERIETAWADWSRQTQNCNERTMTLLRAAFEAGAETAARVNRS